MTALNLPTIKNQFPVESSPEYNQIQSNLQIHSTFTLSYLNNKAALLPSFWQSKFPIENATTLFTSTFAERLLRSYFKKAENTNSELTALLIEHYPELVIQTAKAAEAYKHQPHLEAIKATHPLPLSIKHLHYELSFLNTWHTTPNPALETNDTLLQSIPYETLLIHFVCYWEKVKRSETKGIGNNQWSVAGEWCFTDLLHFMINRKADLHEQHETPIHATMSMQDLLMKANAEMPLTNPPEGVRNEVYLPKEECSLEKINLRQLIGFYGRYYQTQDLITRYCTGQMVFEMIDGLEAELSVTPQYTAWKAQDRQKNYGEYYFINRVKALPPANPELNGYDQLIEETIQHFSDYISILHLSNQFSFEGNQHQINCQDVLKILSYFSKYAMPEGRLIADQVYKIQKPLLLDDLFTPNYIVAFEVEKLKENLKSVFGYTQKKAADLLAFLCTDLTKPPKGTIDFFITPFILRDNYIIWLSTFMRDRKWPSILKTTVTLGTRSRGIQELDKKGKKADTSKMEKGIAQLFTKAGFDFAEGSYKYEQGVKFLEGDVDIMAFHKGHLFLMELKTTYENEDPWKLYNVRYDVFEKGADQLDKALSYIETNYEDFQKKWNTSIPFESLKVHRFLLSTIPEWDHVMIRDDIQKISLLELRIILTDTMKYLHNIDIANQLGETSGKEGVQIPIALIEGFANQRSDYYEGIQSPSKNQMDLWKGLDYCTPEALLEAISENKVWKPFLAGWNFGKYKGLKWSFPAVKDFWK